MKTEQRLGKIQGEIEEINKSLPKHSIPAAMLLKLEKLEEERDRLQGEQERETDASA